MLTGFVNHLPQPCGGRWREVRLLRTPRLGLDALPAGTAEAVPAVLLALASAGCAVGETVALLVGADVG